MKLHDKLTSIIIHLYEWIEKRDPHKVLNEVIWYLGVQVHFAMLHVHKIIDWAIDFATVVLVPLFVWLCLFFFKIWVKHLTAKYLPWLKKYFSNKDESDE